MHSCALSQSLFIGNPDFTNEATIGEIGIPSELPDYLIFLISRAAQEKTNRLF